MSKKVQIWSRTISEHTHHLEVTGEIIRTFVWTIDGEEVLTRKTADDRARLETKEHGSLLVIHSGLGTPRRATYFAPGEDLAGMAGIGGIDLTPEPGSRAAAYERRVLEHPKRYALIETLGGAAGVVAGIVGAMVVAWIVARISLPDIDLPLPNLPDLPDLPDLPLPDLPSIPWPSIPWPDLPNVQVPGWVAWIANHLKYIWPVVLAFVLAQGEIKRRRKHAEASGTSAERSLPSAEKAADDDSGDASDASADVGDASAESGQRRGL
ncbi:hypothetical protein WBG06_03965 [Nocardioides sp. CCNWLW239]|uniref:hypothetical protein n=1 Tax=Nocardioides sp. CCNWLW239 TaxID=3128902 RepID=UPI00301859B7